MISRLAFLNVGLTLCAGCALVSGLSRLDVTKDAGASPDASADSRPDGFSVADGSPDAQHPSGTLCGSTSKSCSGEDSCCLSNASFQCSENCSGTTIRCDDWSDCGGSGKVCCVSLTTDQTAVSGVSCQDQTSCVGKAQLCDPNAPNACPNGMQCAGPAPVGFPSVYFTCK